MNVTKKRNGIDNKFHTSGTIIFNSSGAIVSEILLQPAQNGSMKHKISFDVQEFQKYHGYYGDTCHDDLGGIVWKESEGVFT